MKRAWIALCAFILVTVLLVVAQAVGSNGDGTPGNPYQITNCTELQDMNNNLAAHYVLMNDIDCSDTVNWNGGAGFEPVGTSSTPFAGTFDGQTHTITGLYINRPSTYYVGLFGKSEYSTISNVGLVDVDITGCSTVGALVGMNIGGDITASYVTGRVVGLEPAVGGLVSVNHGGTIENCYAKVNVSSHYWSVGGLVGEHTSGGIIKNCYATGTATDDLFVGGLVGYNPNATIENSYATGSVTAYNYVGGLVGLNSGWGFVAYGTIINCYYNNHAGNPSVGIGYGTGDCTAINDNESYFYYSSNPPMDQWDFVNVWAIDEGVDYPYLIADSDGDGIPDNQDSCPFEDATGFDADGDGCIDTLTGLQEIIEALPDDVLSDEIKNSLVSKVDNALKSADKEKDEAAINILQAFINQIEAQRGKKISEEVADMLIEYANNVIAKIEAG